ncbi:MAG: HesA/MoeB/ThiF family protein [Deltaproteobacteria bacterium]|nr:HesA/MoeB/ThiF family protein [Deltaproteobacteria bacterium]
MSDELKLEEMERYQRQLSIDGFDEKVQKRLKDSAALVAGIGGLGGTAALYLAAAGIGRLALIHEGRLETPDLNRQTLMTSDWVGRSRVMKAKETINKFNPNIEIDAFDEPIKPERLETIISDIDIVLDCRHNFPERRLVNTACTGAGITMIEAAMNGMEGYLFNIIPGKTACLSCLYPEDPVWDPYGFPVLGAVSGTLGCLAAMEAIKILTGLGEPLINALLHFDLGRMGFKRFKTYRREDCKICGRPSLHDTRVSAKTQANVSAESICR